MAKKDKSEKQTETKVSLRPTLYIGLGTFGCSVLRRLKSKIGQASTPPAENLPHCFSFFIRRFPHEDSPTPPSTAWVGLPVDF